MAQVSMNAPKLEDYQIYPISSNFMIQLESEETKVSETSKGLIEAIWEKKGSKLHEGLILSAHTYDSKGLKGQFVPYKNYYAQVQDPSLRADLKIVPVSINGITFMQDQLILGRRAPWVAQYPGRYELAPSGGIRFSEPIDLKSQLLEELAEETGIGNKEVKNVKFFAMIHHCNEEDIELCAEIQLGTPSLILSSSNEYTQVMAISCEEVTSFVKKFKEQFVPLSLILMKLKKLIPDDL